MFALRFNTVIQKYVNSAFMIIIIITIVKTINNTIMILINAFV